MAETKSTDPCAGHPEQPAVARCDHCGKPFCEHCRREDVAAEEEFCSSGCRDERIRARVGPGIATQAELLVGLDRPIRTGWKLWARSLPQLFSHTVPFAALLSYVSWLTDVTPLEETVGVFDVSDGLALFLLAGVGFGIALVQVVLSRSHTGLVKGSPYLWTLQRFVPWLLALVTATAIAMLGMIAMILPGMYLGLRLFWAEEFALIHGVGPLQAVKESWRLTHGEAGPIFRFQFVAGLAAYLVFILGAVAFILLQSALGAVNIPSLGGPAEMFLGYEMIFVGYAALHAPEVVHFYGMRAEKSRSLVESTKTLGLN